MVNYKSNRIKLFDTAGINRKSKINDKSIDFYSIKKTFEKIKEVDTAVILIDALKGLSGQDKRIVNLISNHAKSLIIIFNKQDLVENISSFKKDMIKEIKSSLYQIKNIKVFFCTAFSKNQIHKILDYVYKNVFTKKIDISTNKINKWLKDVTKKKQHPMIKNKHVNFKYAVKIKNLPVTIKIFCSYSNKIKKDYERFLTNNFNNTFNIHDQNTKIVFSKSDNPYK